MVVFIAIELEKNIREPIGAYVRDVVKPVSGGGRWVDSENYHITLKYIGDIRERDEGMLYQLLKRATLKHDAFCLNTGGLGVFGGADNGRVNVLWLDTTGDLTALRALRRYIEIGAMELGFKRNNRFSPHITLARDVLLHRRPVEMERLHPINIKVTTISLMESKVEAGKRVYLPLSVHRLSQAPKGDDRPVI